MRSRLLCRIAAALALARQAKGKKPAGTPLGGGGRREYLGGSARRGNGLGRGDDAGKNAARTAGKRTDAERTKGERTEPEHLAGRYNPVTNPYELVRIDNVTRYGTMISVAAETAALARRLRVGFFYKVGARMKRKLDSADDWEPILDAMRDGAAAIGGAADDAGVLFSGADADADEADRAEWRAGYDAIRAGWSRMMAVARRRLV